MTMQEQARLSGLEFLDDSSSAPQWSTTREEYKPLLGGWRNGHASVVLDNDNEVQSIVVLGGETKDNPATNSVIVWDSSTKQWRQGPSLKQVREYLAAETCNGKVYVIGGWNRNRHCLDTIECIDVASLLNPQRSDALPSHEGYGNSHQDRQGGKTRWQFPDLK